ncbi:MAG: hypothetical protein WC998_01360 [Candidatus Paceibacterota bacterium]|jgi:hypothetical protein
MTKDDYFQWVRRLHNPPSETDGSKEGGYLIPRFVKQTRGGLFFKILRNIAWGLKSKKLYLFCVYDRDLYKEIIDGCKK